MQTIRAYKEFSRTLLDLAWPNVLTNLLSLAIPLSSTLAVGHIGPSVLLGAAALGGMFANATGMAVGTGLAMALDTLCSQAYGAKRYKLVGLHTQRAMLILTLTTIPISIFWWYSGVLLKYISHDPSTVELSIQWVRITIPAMWPRFMAEAFRRYLIGQRVVWPITVSNVVTVPFHVVLTYLLTFHFGYGFAGAAWASTISTWIMFVSMVIIAQARVVYLRRKGSFHHMIELADGVDVERNELSSSAELEDVDNGDPLHTWPDFGRDAFKGWGQFLSLGWATSVSLFVEWGSFEVNAVIAAQISDVALAAHSVLSYTAGLWYSAPAGLSSGATSLVGNMIGAEKPQDAASYYKASVSIVFIYAIINGIIGMFYRSVLGLMFTNDQAVVALVSQLVPWLALYGIADSVKCISLGIIRGCGRPHITVYGNVLTCLFIGYPLAILLVFKGGFGLQGLWFAMFCAWFVVSITSLVILQRTNWEIEVQNAKKRNDDAVADKPADRKGISFSVFEGESDKLMASDLGSSTIFISTNNTSEDEEGQVAPSA